MELTIRENVSEQIYNCICQTADAKGYMVIETDYEFGSSYCLYKQCNWFKRLFKRYVLRFSYRSCKMYIHGVNENNYDDTINLIERMFSGIDGLEIVIEKNFRTCRTRSDTI